MVMRPIRDHVSSRPIERRYEYGLVRSDSLLSTLYMVPETMRDSPAPASRAVGTAKPAATSIVDDPTARNAGLSSPSPIHRIRRPSSAAFRLEIAGSTSFVWSSDNRCRNASAEGA